MWLLVLFMCVYVCVHELVYALFNDRMIKAVSSLHVLRLPLPTIRRCEFFIWLVFFWGGGGIVWLFGCFVLFLKVRMAYKPHG